MREAEGRREGREVVWNEGERERNEEGKEGRRKCVWKRINE